MVVFDIDDGHKFVKRIKTSGLDSQGKPLNVKGVCVSASLKRIYITTTRTMTCLDLVTEKIVWEKPYSGGCDMRKAFRRSASLASIALLISC